MPDPSHDPHNRDRVGDISADAVSTRIRQHLHDEADLVPVLASDSAAADRIERRAVRAQRRRTAVVGAAMALTVGAVGIGAISLSGPKNDVITADQPTDSTVGTTLEDSSATTGSDSGEGEDGTPSSTPGGTEADLISDGPFMTWEPVALNLSDRVFTGVTVHNGEFMTFGNGDDGLALLASPDGVTWNERSSDLAGFEIWELRSVGDALVAIGASAVESGLDPGDEPSYTVGTTLYSIDGGETWTEAVLPTSATELTDTHVSVGAVGSTIVAIHTTFGETAMTSEVFRKIGDGPYEPLTIDGLDLAEGVEVYVVDDHFELTAFSTGQTARSSDATEWELDDADLNYRDIVQTGPEEALSIVYGPGRAQVERSTDGGLSWSAPFELPTGSVTSVARGSDGYVIVVDTTDWETEDSIPDDLPETVSFIKDGLEIVLDFANGEDIAVIDLDTGDEIFRSTIETDSDEGPGIDYDEGLDTVTLSDIETGEIVVTFTSAELSEGVEDQLAGTAPNNNTMIGFTVDGSTFGWQTAEEAFGSSTSWVQLASNGTVTIATAFSSVGLPQIYVSTGPAS